MTRDRPASGGQDSTIEGEFPADIGGGGGKASPVDTEVLSSPVIPSRPANKNGDNPTDIQPKVPSSHLMAINNYPIGGSLKGVYSFNTAGGLFRAGTQSTGTSGVTASFATSINLGQIAISSGYAGGFQMEVTVDPITGTISGLDYLGMRFVNLGGNFASDSIGIAGIQTTISSGSPKSFAFRAAPVPFYSYRYLRTSSPTPDSQAVSYMPFITDSSVSFTARLTGGVGTNPVNIDASFKAYSITGATPAGTYKSSL